MQQYLIIAHDFPDALERRLSVRPQHFEVMRKLKACGNFLTGGAILDEAGNMKGSSIILQFESYSELESWLEREPYLLNRVWDKVEIKPFKVAEL